jgi:hypothetical protein
VSGRQKFNLPRSLLRPWAAISAVARIEGIVDENRVETHGLDPMMKTEIVGGALPVPG